MQKKWTGLLFILPLMIGIFVFAIYPMIESFRLSFYKTNFIESAFVGLRSYRYVLRSELFYLGLWNTLVMMVLQLSISIPSSFILASMINRVSSWKGFFRSGFYLPNLSSIVATIIVIKYIFYSSEAGVVNYVLSIFGVKPIAWFVDSFAMQFTVSLMGSWMVIGIYNIIFLASLQAISKEIYEAAEVDGAKAFKQWLYITIPCSSGTFAFVLIIGIIANMQRFADVFVLRMGSVVRPLQTVVLYIYDLSFKENDFGTSFAAGYLLFFIILIFSMLNVKLTGVFNKGDKKR